MTNPTHLEITLQRDIDRIRRAVTQMSALAERALKVSLQALVENNRQLAYSVILRDQDIDEREKEIDRLCLEFLVRQQPVAGHLRFVYATIKINLELERIGDYAESIARQALKISDLEERPPFDRFVRIANVSIPMLHDAVQAFVNRDAELARKSMVREEEADEVRFQINEDLMNLRQQGKLPIEALTPLMTIARRFERVADQAKNICEETLYACTGEYLRHKGSEVIRVLFVDDDNAALSQMAEAIGNSLSLERFVFSSAGAAPGALDPRLEGFLKEKQLDMTGHTAKTVDRIPNLDHYQVLIALSRGAQKSLVPPPTKTVGLVWDVPDATKVQGSPEEVHAAYDKAFQYLQSHIRDLTQAIIEENQNGKNQYEDENQPQ